MKPQKIIIGVVGPMSSGKGEVIKVLKDLNYTSFSLSNILRNEIEKRKIENTRKNLQDMGNELRNTFGYDVLAKRTIDIIKKNNLTKVVIESIRHPSEMIALKKLKREKYKVIIIGINISYKKCFELILKRNREGDPKNWKDFIISADRDLGLDEPENGQQVAKCLEITDIEIRNDNSLNDFRKKIKETINKLNLKF